MFLNKVVPKLDLDISHEGAIKKLVFLAQQEQFSGIKRLLQAGRDLPQESPLCDLAPVLHSDGLIRVGGRLKRADLPLIVKHPFLLPRNHPLSLSVVGHYHRVNKHQGTHIGHNAVIQAGFFVQNGRELMKRFVHDCIRCRRLRASPCVQLMADLPEIRLEETGPFVHIGIDVMGPLYIQEGKNTRKTSSSRKMWVLVVVCMPSRAVHLEPLYGLDTSSFRNAFSRFQSVRGPVKTVLSDNGTNFQAAKQQIEEAAVYFGELAEHLKLHGVEWTMNPPYSSHRGGSYERLIGSVRRALEASMLLTSNRGLSRDELTTLLAEAMSIVNSTPLWAASTDPNDPAPLTPSMLLTLKDSSYRPLESFADADLLSYGKKRYKRVQYLADQFWKRWREEYLHTLTQRRKWKRRRPCVQVGDLVLLRDKQKHRNNWPMGRVTEVKKSKDGLVRSASLRLAPLPNSNKPRFTTRAITDLVLLISAEDM